MIACLDRAVVDLPPASSGKGQRGGKSRRGAGAGAPAPQETAGGAEKKDGAEVEKVRRLKFTSTERDILQAYKKHGLKDRAKLIQALPRPLRRLYVESWQSAVWNRGAAYRKAKWGERVVAGDLVMVDSVTNTLVTAWDLPHLAKDQGQVRRVVDDDDAALYSIDSVVVPLLGTEVELPGWLTREVLSEACGVPKDPTLENVVWQGHPQREMTLKGSYRHLVVSPREVGLDEVKDEREAQEQSQGQAKLGVSFQLPPGSYATVLLQALSDDTERLCEQVPVTDLGDAPVGAGAGGKGGRGWAPSLGGVPVLWAGDANGGAEH